MSRVAQNARLTIERDFSAIRMQYFLCPDGITRQLHHFEVKNDTLLLEMKAVRQGEQNSEYNWPVHEVEKNWQRFNRISQQQALGKTSLSSASNPALPRLEQHESTVPEVIPATSLPAKVQTAKEQVEELLPMQSFATGLETLFSRLVDTTKPGSKPSRELIDTAKAAEGLAGKAIDMRKLQLEGMKLLVDQGKQKH